MTAPLSPSVAELARMIDHSLLHPTLTDDETRAGLALARRCGCATACVKPYAVPLATATLAANGDMYRPHLVSTIDNLRTGERRLVVPTLVKHVALKPENLEFVKRAMQGVNKEGTGARSFGNAEYTSGGKTGTAQVVGLKQGEKYDEKKVAERHRDHSLFIVFAPLENPKIAVATIVENGGFGARAAAPIARTVLDYYLLGKLPEGLLKPVPDDDEAGAQSD